MPDACGEHIVTKINVSAHLYHLEEDKAHWIISFKSTLNTLEAYEASEYVT